MNQDMCVRCGDGVINIRVGAIIIKEGVTYNGDDYTVIVAQRDI